MRMPGFNAEASLYRHMDSHYMAVESDAHAENGSIVPQHLPLSGSHLGGCYGLGSSPYALCNLCDEDGCDRVVVPKKSLGSAYGWPT